MLKLQILEKILAFGNFLIKKMDRNILHSGAVPGVILVE